MKNDMTEIVFILDRSGSMCGLEDDTIGGFNSYIEKQRKEKGNANVTTILFDDKIELLHDRADIRNIKKMNHRDYYVRGSTALLDAIGYSIHKTIDTQKKLPQHLKADHVVFIITTDGYENASREYNYKTIKNLISRQSKQYQWEFLFLGANMDAVSEASKLGIHSSRAVNYFNDSEGVQATYKAVSKFTSALRTKKYFYDDESDDWKEDVIKDNQRRN